MSLRLEVYPNLELITEEAGKRLVRWAAEAVEQRDSFRIALCGGNSPRGLYQAMAGRFARGLRWTKMTVCLGDERRVPESHPESNTGLVRRLLFDPLPTKPAFFAPDGSAPDGDRAAADYEAALKKAFDDGPLDLSLQGLGDDGHTASIFPGSPALTEAAKWVLAVPAPTTVPPPLPRLTLTASYLVRSRRVLVLVSGRSKREPLRRLLAKDGDERTCPSRLLHRCEGEAVVLCDQDSAPS